MKNYLIFLLFYTYFIPGYSQTGALNTVCDCYKNLDYLIPFDDLKSQVEKCVKKGTKKFKNDFDLVFNKSDNSFKFIEIMSSNCPDFYEFIVHSGLNGEKITDKERIEKIDYLASYFSFPIMKGKTPKTFIILPTEQGVLYNSYFNQISPDSLFGEGTFTLPFYDSVIVSNLLPQKYSTIINLKLADNSELTLDLTFIIELKKDKVGYLLKNFGSPYDKTLLLPEVRISTRTALSNLTTSGLHELDEKELSNLIIGATLNTVKFKEYATLIAVYINHIDYPEIMNAAIKADLLKEYNDLKNVDIEIRKKALDSLFENSSNTAYLIILNHWQFEHNKIIQDYIIYKLTYKKK